MRRDPLRAPFSEDLENIEGDGGSGFNLDSETGQLVFGSDQGDIRIDGGKKQQIKTEDYKNPSPETPDWTASIINGAGTAPDPDTDLQESGGNLELTIPDSATFYRYRRAYDSIPYEYGTIELSIEIPSNYITGLSIIDSQNNTIDQVFVDAVNDQLQVMSEGTATPAFPIDGKVNLTLTADSNQLSIRLQQTSSGYDETVTVSRASDTGNDMFLSLISGIQSGSIKTQEISPITISSTNLLSQIKTDQIDFDFGKIPDVDIADNDGNNVTAIGGFETFNQLTFGPAIDLKNKPNSNFEAQINGSNLPFRYSLNNEDELKFTGLSSDLTLQGVAGFARGRYINWSDESSADYTVKENGKIVNFGEGLQIEGPGLGTVQSNDGQNPRPDEDWRLVFNAEEGSSSPADIAIGLDNVTGDFSRGDADVSVVYDVTNEQFELNTNVETKTVPFPKDEVLGGQDVVIEYTVSENSTLVKIQNTVTDVDTLVGAQIDSSQFSAPDDIGFRNDGVSKVTFKDLTKQTFSSKVINTIDDNRVTEDYFIQNQDNLVLQNSNGVPSSPKTGELVYNDDTNNLVLNTSAGSDFDFDVASIADVNSAVNDPSTSNPTRSFGTWNEVDPELTGFVSVEATVETDGTTEGKVNIEVDESGGTTADYTFTVVNAPPGFPSGTNKQASNTSINLPPGAQYRIVNASDPNNANTIDTVREFTF